MPHATTLALLGAESTGKTWLAQRLAQHWREAGRTVIIVPEVLREWCDKAGRTPQAHEQQGIAEEQARRTQAACAAPVDLVIADTTPLMTALYSHLLFDDRSLYPFAQEHHRIYAHTLVTGLDLPWVADGLQRDGPGVRGPVDALVRRALADAGVAFKVIYGQGEQRLQQALRAVGPVPGQAEGTEPQHGRPPDPINPDLRHPSPPPRSVRWRWSCEKCSDPECEHRLFAEAKRPT